ncbi:cupin-like domain-containing protein [Nostoc sp.]|uniref:cupin-like domain-containing protein n=1 Tax=Nostoc sp. TaxID=1180 RepID=UPI002FF73C43
MKVAATESIPKIKNPSTEEFLEIWKQYQPFLVEDVVNHWGASNNWSNDYLIKQCGNNLIPIQFFKKDFLKDYHNFACEDGYSPPKEIKFKDYIKDYIEDREKNYDLGCYLYQVDFEEYLPEIVGDITDPGYLNRNPLVQFWFGYSSKDFTSTTALHFDAAHNTFVQIRGRKRILLFPPSNYLSFYPPLKDNSGFGHHSKVNPDIPNLELFPKFPWEEKIEVILQPGEMLYIPPFWWHHVTAVDENISLSFFYDIEMGDILKQKNLLSTIFNIVPHYLYRSFYSREALGNTISMFKSLLSLGSFTKEIRENTEQSIRENNSNNK